MLETSLLQSLDQLRDQVATALRHAGREVLNAKQAAAVADAPAGVLVSEMMTIVGPAVAATPAVPPAEAVLRMAEAEWRSGVAEPGTPGMPNGVTIIDRYIRGALGLGWSTCDIVNWKPGVPYTRNGQFAWCGAFAAFCYGSAGLKAELRSKHFSGTPRLYKWAKGTPRFIAAAGDMHRGDIVVVGPGGDIDGAHITVYRGSCRTDAVGRVVSFDTFEGNAHGVGPTGLRYEGVVANTRKVNSTTASDYRFAFAVRPLPEDFGL